VVIALVAVLGAVLLRDQVSLESLARHREALLAYRDAHYPVAVLGFMAAYVAIVGFSLPGATVATLTGGFLFGLFPGVIYNVLSATAGAIAIFLAARLGLGAEVAAGIAARGGAPARLQASLGENQWSVLFLMRLLPAVPFFLANLLPAFAGVRLWPFALTTFLGIMPGTLVLTSVGAGLGEVFAAGAAPDLSVLTSPQVLGPILGLALLAGLPLALRLWQARRARA
jgi:uncharacterized membrane protein YdjX (TVP38/TMEM64 family)